MELEARPPDVKEKAVKPTSLEEEKAMKLPSLEVRSVAVVHLKLIQTGMQWRP